MAATGRAKLFIDFCMVSVMECPDEDWIDAIVENKVFLNHQEETAKDKELIAQYIVHFTPENVLNNKKYRDWMRKFGKDTKHLIINEENKGGSSEAMHKMQHQLHLLHETIFPFFGGQKYFSEKSMNQSLEKKLREESMAKEDSTPSENTEAEENKNMESDEVRLPIDFSIKLCAK